jgi:hypothetical protein
VETPRSVFLLCELAAGDPRFERYPRLPLLACPGYAPRDPDEPPASADPAG